MTTYHITDDTTQGNPQHEREKHDCPYNVCSHEQHWKKNYDITKTKSYENCS